MVVHLKGRRIPSDLNLAFLEEQTNSPEYLETLRFFCFFIATKALRHEII